MLRRIKRFLGFSARGAYFPNNEVAPADGSLISTSSRKSTKSEKKSAKKEKKKSPLVEDHHDAPAFIHVATPPTDIIIGGEETLPCSASETDRQTVITDSLPYREPSDKVFIEPSQPEDVLPTASSSTRSLAGSTESMKARLDSVTADMGVMISRTESFVESVYSTDLTQDTESQKTCDARSRELPVDCELPPPPPPKILFPDSPHSSSISEASSMCVNFPTMTKQQELEELTGGPGDTAAMQKLNAELDGLLKKSAPPFQVSTARLMPMLTKELPPPTGEESLLSNDEFDDSKNNSVARILNESHEATMRSPENKHLRSYGY